MRSLFALAALRFAFGSPVPTEQAPETKSDYIVVLKSHLAARSVNAAFSSSILQGLETFQEYNLGSLRGFAASLTASQVDALNKESKVAYVEADGDLKIQLYSKRAP